MYDREGGMKRVNGKGRVVRNGVRQGQNRQRGEMRQVRVKERCTNIMACTS